MAFGTLEVEPERSWFSLVAAPYAIAATGTCALVDEGSLFQNLVRPGLGSSSSSSHALSLPRLHVCLVPASLRVGVLCSAGLCVCALSLVGCQDIN